MGANDKLNATFHPEVCPLYGDEPWKPVPNQDDADTPIPQGDHRSHGM